MQASLKGKSNDQRREINQQIQDLKEAQDPVKLARVAASAMGLRQDPVFLSYLTDWMETFYPGGYEITIVPEEQTDRVVFRGILDKKFLRLQPEYLRSLYGGYVSTDWVIVGQITYLPGTKIPDVETIPLATDASASTIDGQLVPPINTSTVEPILSIQTEEQGQALLDAVNTPSDSSPMRDPFRGLFRSSAYFDKMFFESKTRVEVLLRPLAILGCTLSMVQHLS